MPPNNNPSTPVEPLIVRARPPQASRISRNAFLIAAGIVAVPFVLFLAIKFQGRAQALQVVQPPPLPTHDQISKRGPVDTFKVPTTHAGLDMTPKAAPTPAPAVTTETEPVFAQTPAVTTPTPTPPAPAPAPQPPGATAAAPPAPPPPQAPTKKEPRRWLSNLQSTILESPFKQGTGGPDQGARVAENTGPPTEAHGGTEGKGVQGKALLASANWIRPGDPTRVLYAGQVIHAQTLHAIDSTVPGLVRCLVTQHVMDRMTMTRILIPQQSILIGQQAPQEVRFGEARLTVMLTEIQFPSGEILALGDAKAADASGASGISGRLDNHWGQLLSAAGISAVLSIGARAPAGNQQGFAPTLGQEAAGNFGASVSSAGQAIVMRSLQVRPTIKIEAGTAIVVSPTVSISLQQPPTISTK